MIGWSVFSTLLKGISTTIMTESGQIDAARCTKPIAMIEKSALRVHGSKHGLCTHHPISASIGLQQAPIWNGRKFLRHKVFYVFFFRSAMLLHVPDNDACNVSDNCVGLWRRNLQRSDILRRWSWLKLSTVIQPRLFNVYPYQIDVEDAAIEAACRRSPVRW